MNEIFDGTRRAFNNNGLGGVWDYWTDPYSRRDTDNAVERDQARGLSGRNTKADKEKWNSMSQQDRNAALQRARKVGQQQIWMMGYGRPPRNY